jgi:hypothetical protein
MRAFGSRITQAVINRAAELTEMHVPKEADELLWFGVAVHSHLRRIGPSWDRT